MAKTDTRIKNTATQATDLYQRTILDHNKSPRYYGELADPTHQAQGHNPICGDVVHLAAKIEDSSITQLYFTAQSCALCKASASIMCDSLQKLSLAQVLVEVERFLNMIKVGSSDVSSELSVFSIVRDFPARAKCVMLPWKTLLGALVDQPRTGSDRVISTEAQE